MTRTNILSGVKQKQEIIHHFKSLQTQGAVQYCCISGSSVASSTENTTMNVSNKPGIFRHLRIALRSASGAGKTSTFTFRKNSAASSLVVAIAGDTLKTGYDGTHEVVVAAGDLLTIEMNLTAAGTGGEFYGSVAFMER